MPISFAAVFIVWIPASVSEKKNQLTNPLIYLALIPRHLGKIDGKISVFRDHFDLIVAN